MPEQAPLFDPPIVVRGLTLWQPMAWAIAAGHKRIENRPWRYPEGGRITHIAVHAGAKFHRPHAEQIEALGIRLPDSYDHGGIIAVARLVRAVHFLDEVPEVNDPWFSGPWGFVLDDVVAVPFLPCKGALGLWRLPEDIQPVVEAACRR